MEAVVTTTKKKEDGTLHCASVGFCAYQTELCFESRLLGRLQAKKKTLSTACISIQAVHAQYMRVSFYCLIVVFFQFFKIVIILHTCIPAF